MTTGGDQAGATAAEPASGDPSEERMESDKNEDGDQDTAWWTSSQYTRRHELMTKTAFPSSPAAHAI